MVLGKLIGKRSFRENLGAAATTFQSFDDDSDLGQSGPCELSPMKPPTLSRRANTVGGATTRQETTRLSSPSGRAAPSLLRQPSFEKKGCLSDTGSDENATEQQSSESECSDGSSSWSSYGVDEIPEQFHMSTACTINAPAQFVVPTLSDKCDAADKANDSDSDLSLLRFTPLLGDEYHSVHPDDYTEGEEIVEMECAREDVSRNPSSIKEKQSRPKQRQAKKHAGSRVKRRSEDRVLKARTDESSHKINSCIMDEAAPTKKDPKIHNVSYPSSDDNGASLTPCPRSPAKNLRNFKRTNAIPQVPEFQAAVGKHCTPRTPGTKSLQPLSKGISCPKTKEQLPMLNPLDSCNPSATPIHYAVDLNRQSPVKQRQKYVLGESVEKHVPPIEVAGGLTEFKAPSKGSRRGSLQHGPRPPTSRQPRRLSCPISSDDDNNEDSYERVIGLIDSHSREAASSYSREVVATPTRRKKSTVDDMKRKIQKDRERIEEKRLQGSVTPKRSVGNKRISSPRRTGKGKRIASRQPLFPVAVDLSS